MFACCTLATEARADVWSTFTTGLENWTWFDGNVVWKRRDGNPGGFLQQTESTSTERGVSESVWRTILEDVGEIIVELERLDGTEIVGFDNFGILWPD
jgi:hypothetical protein